MDLQSIKEKYQPLVEAWNGEDTTFNFEGSIKTEHEVLLAKDILDLVESLQHEKDYLAKLQKDIAKDEEKLQEWINKLVV